MVQHNFASKNSFLRTQNNRGFTLIELIVVIVILGILAATALPKYLDMRRQSRIAALQGFEGGLRSGIETAMAIYITKAGTLNSFPGYPGYILKLPTNDGVDIAVHDGRGAGSTNAQPLILPNAFGVGVLMGCQPLPQQSNTFDCQGFVGSMATPLAQINNGGAAIFNPSGVPFTGLESRCFVSYNGDFGDGGYSITHDYTDC